MILTRIYPSLHFSPWPIQRALTILAIITSVIIIIKTRISILLFLRLFSLIFLTNFWLKDIIIESSGGEYTLQTLDNIKYGLSLFIFSEVILFLSFLWAFLHYSFSPSVLEGHIWPSYSVIPIKGGGLPLINTALLLSRGVTVTWRHHQLISGNKKEAILGLVFTIILGSIFLINQGIELQEASFSIRDGTFGRVFLTLTGLHGRHVLVGLILLIGNLKRVIQNQLTSTAHTGIEISIWYWHFVDVVWIFVYSLIYWWGA